MMSCGFFFFYSLIFDGDKWFVVMVGCDIGRGDIVLEIVIFGVLLWIVYNY